MYLFSFYIDLKNTDGRTFIEVFSDTEENAKFKIKKMLGIPDANELPNCNLTYISQNFSCPRCTPAETEGCKL